MGSTGPQQVPQVRNRFHRFPTGFTGSRHVPHLLTLTWRAARWFPRLLACAVRHGQPRLIRPETSRLIPITCLLYGPVVRARLSEYRRGGRMVNGTWAFYRLITTSFTKWGRYAWQREGRVPCRCHLPPVPTGSPPCSISPRTFQRSPSDQISRWVRFLPAAAASGKRLVCWLAGRV